MLPGPGSESVGSQDEVSPAPLPVSSDDGSVSPKSTAGPSPMLPSEPALSTAKSQSSANKRAPASFSGNSKTARASEPGHSRMRGYSLRRSIFAQNIQKERIDADQSIEMDRPGTSSSQTLRDDEAVVSEKQSTITTATEPLHNKEKDFAHSQALHDTWTSKAGSGPNGFIDHKRQWRTILKRIFEPKLPPPSPDGRHVRVNSHREVRSVDERTGKPHIDNTVISCRYTPWNFFPRQLVAQFGKLANFYFLCISILQLIPGLSTTGTFTTLVPLLIFVGISMGKEGYDDLRRHRLDKEENEREIFVLDRQTDTSTSSAGTHAESGYPETASTGWRTEKWQDIRVGDVVLLLRDEPAPADMALLHADEPTGSAYIETKSLDGETNLKTKKPLAELSDRCHNLDSVADLPAEFVVEDPNLDLYKFDGRVSVGGTTLPLTNSEVVYRGSVLRNTPSALGLVIYSGEECKIRMNANKSPRTKAPALQAAVNRVVVFVAALVFAIGFLLTGLYLVWRQTTERESWYLTAARVPFGYVFTSFIIMLNTMLPLSLYVSLEIVKVAQMFMMNDIDMYDPESDTPMEPHTSTINEELGQVSYIFSDKTGTLTNNSMKFRKISIAGTAWLHDMDIRDEISRGDHLDSFHKKRAGKGKDKAVKKKVSEQQQRTYAMTNIKAREQTDWKPSTRAADSLQCGKTEQLLAYLRLKPQTSYAQKAKFFILALALCHTCIPENDENGNIRFQAASPDELALVTAAQELDYIVTDRQSKSITVKTYPNGEAEDAYYESYEIMDIIEFSSMRKRMSIIVRLPDQRLCLFTKGADTTISKLLRLAELAGASASTVCRRASHRKSIEAQEVLLRRSAQLRAGSQKSKSSFSLSEPGIGVGRASSVSTGTKRSDARDGVDRWLTEREREVDLSSPRRSNSIYTPRQSVQHSTPRASGYHDASSDSGPASVMALEAEDLIDEAVTLGDSAIFERCFQHIDDFATEGLRTLLYGYRLIPEQEYQEWCGIYASVSTSLDNRQEKMEAVGELIEKDLELLGATAIEDKLQKGVPDAIDRLRRAGIKMWMLTGDKRETAINIGHSCRLIKDYSTVTVIDQEQGELGHSLMDALAIVKSDRVAHSVLVIDGQTLTVIDADSTLKSIFTDIAISAESVICCRASPSQKASLVKTIRTKVKKSVTLAIGDGANDIAMIQEAHVGIGIAGKEGLQAARTSDYSIGQFRFLLKLLLVHGRWNYVRICKYTLGTFWKEMIFYLAQAMYQRWNGYTGTSLYEPWSLTLFNTLFTSLPVIFLGVFDKDLAASTLLAVPELYSIGREHKGFSFKLYAWWAAMGAAEAMMVFFIMFGIYGEALFTRDNRLYAMGTLVFSTCVIAISIKLQIIELHNKSSPAAIAILLSVGGWWMWNLALSALYNKYKPIYHVNHGFIERFGRNPLWWLTLLLGVLTVVLFEITIKSVRTAIWPSDVDVFQALEHDLEVRQRFEEAASDLLQQGWDRGSKKTSLDFVREEEKQAEHEAQVQQLLERPRTLDATIQESGVGRRQYGHTESGDEEPRLEGRNMAEGKMQDEMRRSVDVAELFSRGFGKVKTGQALR